jgi:hypothetical protein
VRENSVVNCSMNEASQYEQYVLATDRTAHRGASLVLSIVLSLIAITGLWLAGQGQLLRIAIPAAAALVGLVLYLNRPILFVQYALWVWFLAPLVRRVVDWHFGFTEPNFVLLAPFAVSSIAGLTIFRSGIKIAARTPAAFVLCAGGVLYGFSVGMVTKPSAESVFGLVAWLCPILFGLHLFSTWHLYEQYRAAIGRTFLWAVFLLGAYGVYQFFFPPSWDRYWLENVMATSPSFGLPESLLIRVWSTLNSPAPFANFMVVGLLLLVSLRSPLKFLAALAGYVSFLLSIVRSAWLSWIIGFVVLLRSTRPRRLIGVVFSLILLLGCLLFIVNDPRLSTVIGDRLNTFTDLGHDVSFGARMEMYRVLAVEALRNPFGRGLRNLETYNGMVLDSGVLTLIFSLGWLGTALYTFGLVSLFAGRKIFDPTDEFPVVSRAIMIAILAQLVAGDVFANVTGALFWIFGGMYLAAIQYHEARIPVVARAPGSAQTVPTTVLV